MRVSRSCGILQDVHYQDCLFTVDGVIFGEVIDFKSTVKLYWLDEGKLRNKPRYANVVQDNGTTELQKLLSLAHTTRQKLYYYITMCHYYVPKFVPGSWIGLGIVASNTNKNDLANCLFLSEPKPNGQCSGVWFLSQCPFFLIPSLAVIHCPVPIKYLYKYLFLKAFRWLQALSLYLKGKKCGKTNKKK